MFPCVIIACPFVLHVNLFNGLTYQVNFSTPGDIKVMSLSVLFSLILFHVLPDEICFCPNKRLYHEVCQLRASCQFGLSYAELFTSRLWRLWRECHNML